MFDLYTGLIKRGNKKHTFWGKYAYLNEWNEKDLNDSLLFRLQLVHLKNLEQSNNKQYNTASQFIKMSSELLQLEDQGMNEALDSVYGKLLQYMNAAFISSELNPLKNKNGDWASREEKNANMDQLMIEIRELLNKIKLDEGIDKAIVDNLEYALTHRREKNVMATYQQTKADYAEKIAVDILNKNPIWKTIQTGNFVDKIGQQLIEDSMTFSKDSLNIPFSGGSINYQITNKDTGNKFSRSAGSLNEFFQQLEKTDQTYTINLSDELYGALQQASILNTQVKSGLHAQPILTRAARNAITLAECGFSDFGLWRLYTLQDSNKYFKLSSNQNSKQLGAIANYYLSKSIAKTNLAKNQLYYTELGFTTASKWMEVNRQMLKFYPEINSMTLNMLTIPRQYRFRQVE